LRCFEIIKNMNSPKKFTFFQTLVMCLFFIFLIIIEYIIFSNDYLSLQEKLIQGIIIPLSVIIILLIIYYGNELLNNFFSKRSDMSRPKWQRILISSIFLFFIIMKIASNFLKGLHNK
jgi:hypothetical protein